MPPTARLAPPSRSTQKLVQRARDLTKKKQFAQAQHLLEARLRQRLGAPDKVALQNALADAHFAWGLYLRHSASDISWRSDFQWEESGFEQAVVHFQRAYATDKILRSDKATDDLLAMSSSHLLALSVSNMDDEAAKAVSDKVARCTQQALTRSRKSHNVLGQATALRNLGWLALLQQHNPEALRYYGQSLTLYRQLPNTRKEQGYRMGNMGLIYRKTGEFDKFLRAIEQERQIFHSIGFTLGEGGTYAVMGGGYTELNRWDLALSYFQKASKYYQRDKTAEGIRTFRLSQIDIGYAYIGLKQYQKALNINLQALPWVIKIKDPGALSDIRLNLGDIYMRLKRYPEALLSYQQSVDSARKMSSTLSPSYQGVCHSAVGAACLKLKRYPEALQAFNQALTINHEAGYTINTVEILGHISEAYVVLNQPQKAIAYGKQAVNLIQVLRRNSQNLDDATQSSFLAANRENYERLAALLVKANRLDEAEQVLRFLRQQDAFEFVKHDPNLRQELASLFQPLLYSAADARELPASLTSGAKLGQGVKEGQTWQSALQGREQAGAGRAALLSTFNTDDAFYVIVTTAKTRRAFSVPIKRHNFDALTRRLQEALSNPNEDPRPDALTLYKTVFCNGQLEHALQAEGITTALWFSSGSLRYIPMDALYDGMQYLVQKPRINVLVTLTSRRLFGDIKQGETLAAGVSQSHQIPAHFKGGSPLNFGALSNVPTEVRSIVQDAPDGGTGPFPGHILLDKNFTASNLKQALKGGASTIHIATHFDLNAKGDGESFFLLGDGTPLPLKQWKQTLKLKGVGLLTLSACETGVSSPDASGGEVSSIGEVSQWLGAQSVIVSLWSVADSSTSALMGDFYARWHANPQEGKAQALRDAQRALLGTDTALKGPLVQRGRPQQEDGNDQSAPIFVKDPAHPFAHPFYWAPFSLIGNWK